MKYVCAIFKEAVKNTLLVKNLLPEVPWPLT